MLQPCASTLCLFPSRVLFQVGVELQLVRRNRVEQVLVRPLTLIVHNEATLAVLELAGLVGTAPVALKLRPRIFHTEERLVHCLYGSVPALEVVDAEAFEIELYGALAADLLTHVQTVAADEGIAQLRHVGVGTAADEVEADVEIGVADASVTLIDSLGIVEQHLGIADDWIVIAF